MAESVLENEVASSDSFTFTRNSVERRIRRNQISLQRLSSMFEVEPASLHLVEEFGEITEWPNSEGKFHMAVFRPSSLIRVEGRSASTSGSATMSMSQVLPATPSTSSFSPLFRSVIPAQKKKASNIVTVKVTLALKVGGKVTSPTRQTYVLIDESSANVDHILAVCQQEFGDTSLSLVTANGLKIENSEATRGLGFWKMSSRKIFAVPQSKGKHPRKRKSEEHPVYVFSDDDDNDFYIPPAQVATPHLQDPHLTSEVKSAVLEAFKLGPQERQVYQDIIESFNCLICKEIIKTDVQVAGCCGAIIGCKACLDTWYGENESCPKCRFFRGDEKVITLRGFGDILAKVQALQPED